MTKKLVPATLLAMLAAAPALADRLACDPVFSCADQSCQALPGSDPEGFDYVDNASGAAPQIYVSEGTWAPAGRQSSGAVTTFVASAPGGGTAMLTVAQDGSYIMVRRQPGGGVTIASGRCEVQP